MAVERVAVIGAGTMGSQIALQTALSGVPVTLVDSDPAAIARARAQNQKLVARSVAKGRLTEPAAAEILARISESTDVAAAVAEVDLVIEAIVENRDAKRDLFRRLDAAAPAHAILASNSSSIGISGLAEVTSRPDRCCNLHFFHPVTVMELCEVVRGPATSDQTVEAAMEFVRRIGRVPVLINREIHGFIVNRILFAAAEEALQLLEGGYASFEDIDIAVKKGLNWPMGPFELMDFSGIDVYVGVMDDRHRLGEGPAAPALLRRMVERGELGRKSGRGFYDYHGPHAG